MAIACQTRERANKTGAVPPPMPAQPGSDEIEVIVMGPGTGESILIHVGNGNWLIVDSYLISETDDQGDAWKPAPIQYLNEIGVDCAEFRQRHTAHAFAS